MATHFLIKWWDNLRQMVSLDTIPAWWECPFSRCTAYWLLQARTEKWAPGKERVSAQGGEPWTASFVTEDLLEKQLSMYIQKDLSNHFFCCVILSIPHQTPGCWSQPLICFFLIITTKPLFIPWLVSSWICSLIQQTWSSTNRGIT